MASTNIVNLKLLIDSKCQRVLFAEAGKDFVDFLFNILSLPIGTVIRHIKQDMPGSLGNLYVSLENLGEIYMQPTANKDILFKHEVVSNYTVNVPPLLPDLPSSTSTQDIFYRCAYNTYNYSSCGNYFTIYPNSVCPSCDNLMSQQATFVNPSKSTSSSAEKGGYVKGVVTYMIMDDLVVGPMSTISCVTLLSKFNIKDVGVLEEKIIDLGIDEAVNLLKMSLHSKTVLTDLFLGKKVENANPPAILPIKKNAS